MTIKGKVFKVLSWAFGAVLVASVAWAAVGWRVDDYGNIKSARSTVLLSAGQTSNCKLSISGSTLSVVGLDGNALSASNPCRVGLNDGTIASFTSPVSVTFGASSDTDGNLFGLSAVNWSSPMPFYLLVVDDGSNRYFAIGRKPFVSTGATVAMLCQKNDVDCDDDSDVMLLTTGVALSSWVSKPAIKVGWFQATFANSGSAWTFTTASPSGFNRANNDLWWTQVRGHGGADNSSTYVLTNAGTEPTCVGDTFVYNVTDDCDVTVSANGTNFTGGVGSANPAYLAVPLSVTTVAGATTGAGYYRVAPRSGVASINSGNILLMNPPNTAEMNDTIDDSGLAMFIRYKCL